MAQKNNNVLYTYIVLVLVVMGTAGGGLILRYVGEGDMYSSSEHTETQGGAPVSPAPEALEQSPEIATAAAEPDESELSDEERSFKRHFEAAAKLLQAGRYAEAEEVLELMRTLRPHVPEVFVNLGFAQLSQGRPYLAAENFEKAIAMRSTQVNAYFGLAASLEEQGDLEGALGAMRTYIHLTDEDDPFRRKAMSATWEWEELLNLQRQEAAAKADETDENPAQASAEQAPQ